LVSSVRRPDNLLLSALCRKHGGLSGFAEIDRVNPSQGTQSTQWLVSIAARVNAQQKMRRGPHPDRLRA
jgi:hypothetical protein